MADILGVGITHYPPLLGEPESYANLLRMVLKSPHIPEQYKSSDAWPDAMQKEWAHEAEAARDHQARHKAALAEVRQAIDDFQPDAVIIFGDDQYENFRENIIPPFNMYCMDRFPTQPFARMGALGATANIWNASQDFAYEIPGAGRMARELADGIIGNHCPIAYSYSYLNDKHLTHAFANALVYLDWDQKGWDYPIIPVSVNCYGTGVVHTRGAMAQLFDARTDEEKDPYLDFPGPSGPTPHSCFALGRALREVLEQRSERFVVMASSGWSHAFLTAKHHWLYPDRAYDRKRVEELQAGQQSIWQNLDDRELEAAGGQEFKNWICLAGVFPDRQAQVIDYLETWIFNSQKCFALLT